jgi:hypothetical protein
MKKFLLKSILFFSIIFVLANIGLLYRISNDRYQHIVTGSEVYSSLHKSKQTNKSSSKIILGDSVAKQLFDNITNNDSINSLACNQSIGMVGHFILLNNYINAGNHVEVVYLIYTPFSFKNNLDQVYTYHYFLKPFYTDENFPLFTKTVIEQLQKIPYYYLCRVPYILVTNWAPKYVSKDTDNYTFLSPISQEYLVKIKELSIEHHFKVIVLPTPTKLSSRQDVERMNKNEIMINNLDDEFKNYFSNIIYLDDDFFQDAAHLKNPQPYTEYYKKNFIK